MPKRILLPLDQTPEAESVLPVVADAARGGDATVRLLHVAPVPDNIMGTDDYIIAYADQEAARLRAEATDYFRSVEAHLDGIAVERAVRFGEPAKEIVLEAEDFGADLIAMTTRCRGPLSQLILGSTAKQVCRLTDKPLMVYWPGSHGCA